MGVFLSKIFVELGLLEVLLSIFSCHFVTINQKILTFEKLGFFYISGNNTSHQNKLKIAEKVSFSCFLNVQI
jgi:hypothetical protein